MQADADERIKGETNIHHGLLKLLLHIFEQSEVLMLFW